MTSVCFDHECDGCFICTRLGVCCLEVDPGLAQAITANPTLAAMTLDAVPSPVAADEPPNDIRVIATPSRPPAFTQASTALPTSTPLALPAASVEPDLLSRLRPRTHQHKES